MKAVLRLIWTYFTATPLLRGMLATGLALILFGAVGHLFVSRETMLLALLGEWQGWFPVLVFGLPWLGLVLMLAASTLMPAIVERISLGRAVWVLPHGRVCVLLSVVLTALLLALLIAAHSTVVLFVETLGVPADQLPGIFKRTLFMAFVDLGLVYAAIWLVSKTRGIWRLVGVLGVIICITIPLRLVSASETVSPLEGVGLAGWLGFGGLLLAGGRVRHAFSNLQRNFVRSITGLSPSSEYRAGREIDLMLGTTHPWLIALGQVVPIAVMAALIRYTDSWLSVLMIFSAMAGAVTSQAALRSRRFWLRLDRTRKEIGRQVETAFWRYNASSLAVLLALYHGLALYAGFEPAQVIHGWILLTLGCATCTYLGLMITRGLGWFESVLCILTLSTLVIAAVATMRGYFTLVIELELVLAALAIGYRYMAQLRWVALDWMRCR